MRKPKLSPRRPKPKKCAPRTMTEIAMRSEPYERCEMYMRKQFFQGQEIERYRAEADALRIECTNLAAERDEARKQHLVATTRNVELTGELRKLQAFKDLALGLAQRDLAGNLHIKAEDAKNCLQ